MTTSKTFNMLTLLGTGTILAVGAITAHVAKQRARPEHLAPKRRRFARFAKPLGALVLLIVLLAGWRVAAPTNLGGQASYAMTSGESMLPGIRSGDLVITRRQQSYRVGDVVSYRNGQLDKNVVHRIVRTSGDRFVLKGDNNIFEDAYRPTAAEIVGARWVLVPRAGNMVQRLHHAAAGIFGAGLAIFAFAGVELPSRRRKATDVAVGSPS